jgi:glycosyltransferase involved in cell wall biosynthesis
MKNDELRQEMSKKAKESSNKYNVDNIMEQWLALFSKIK